MQPEPTTLDITALETPHSTRSVVLKVIDIDPQGSNGPSKRSINSHGVEWRSLNGPQVVSICSDCVLFYYAFQVKSIQINFDTYFPYISSF